MIRGTKKKQLNYAVVLDKKALSEHREIFKQNLSSDGTLPRGDVKNVKRLKSNNLFNVIVNAIYHHKTVSPHLDSRWFPNYVDGKCVKWSLWKADRSGVEKTINLYEDLTAELFVNEKKIFLPEMQNISGMDDLLTFFKKVCQIIPCKTANYDAKESENACTGFNSFHCWNHMVALTRIFSEKEKDSYNAYCACASGFGLFLSADRLHYGQKLLPLFGYRVPTPYYSFVTPAFLASARAHSVSYI